MVDFNRVYSDNHKKILYYINSNIKNYEIAEELTNDVFIKVHKNLLKYDEKKATIATWVAKIAKYTIIDYYRSSYSNNNNRTSNLDAELNSNIDKSVSFKDVLPTTDSNPLKQLISSEVSDVIQKQINSLPKQYRDVSNLFFNEHCSYQEIANRLSIPIGTVRGQINRARVKLVNKLETIRL